MEHIAQGKRSDTLGLPHSGISAPCKGKSFNPLCCYSYLIAEFAVLKWNIVCIFCSTPGHVLKLLPLQGATAPTRDTQGAASLALGYVLHWAFSPPLLNPKLEMVPYPHQWTNYFSLPHSPRVMRSAADANSIRKKNIRTKAPQRRHEGIAPFKKSVQLAHKYLSPARLPPYK